jgi:hypothetical protein
MLVNTKMKTKYRYITDPTNGTIGINPTVQLFVEDIGGVPAWHRHRALWIYTGGSSRQPSTQRRRLLQAESLEESTGTVFKINYGTLCSYE